MCRPVCECVYCVGECVVESARVCISDWWFVCEYVRVYECVILRVLVCM